MAASCIMKQVQDCHMTVEVVKCAWSPKMDLLAIANSQGQVAMHRLTFQKVWQANPPSEHSQVTGLAWRPDSKVLAVGYSTGEVILMDIENSNEIHRITLQEEITTISWILHCSQQNVNEIDYWEKYMAPLPPLSKSYGGSDNLKSDSEGTWHETPLLQDQTSLTLLTVSTLNSTIHLYGFGLFHCASYDLKKSVEGAGKILDALPSHDLQMISIVLERNAEDGKKEIAQVSLETLIISLRHKELCALAHKYGQIYTLMTYADHVLTHIEEAWESILLEMDDKLTDYAKTVPEGGVSADFLDLLVFGYSTPEFNMFLADKLSDKGLKKLRHSVELSYSNMEKLVVKNLQSVGQALYFLLSQVVGMARREDRYAMLGLKEQHIIKAVREAAAFLLKAVEVQQVIEISMRDFNAFLKWLSRVILRHTRDQIPPELSMTTQQEQNHIINFLQDSLEETTEGSDGQKRTRFLLERVGQYLKDEPLTKPYKMDHNPWVKFLASNEELASHSLIIPHNPDQSLKQTYNNLKTILHEMVAHPIVSICEALKVISIVSIVDLDNDVSAKVSQVSLPDKEKIYTTIVPDNHKSIFYFGVWSSDSKHLTSALGPGPQKHVNASPFAFSSLNLNTSRVMDKRNFNPSSLMFIIDAQFYTENTLSLLLQEADETKATYFAQLWVPAAIDEIKPLALPKGCRVGNEAILPRDASALLDSASHHRLEIGVSSGLAVSGSRNVSVIIAENKKRIRLYEMEADEDEEDEEEEES